MTFKSLRQPLPLPTLQVMEGDLPALLALSWVESDVHGLGMMEDGRKQGKETEVKGSDGATHRKTSPGMDPGSREVKVLWMCVRVNVWEWEHTHGMCKQQMGCTKTLLQVNSK